MKVVLAAALLVPCCSVMAQKMEVKITNRQSNATDYSYVVPGRSSASTTGNANCYGGSSTINCMGSARTTGYSTASQAVSFSVTGATFSLLLPDGRVAVVNCVSKFTEHMAGPRGNHRSCRTPLLDNIMADFKGKNAKLIWPASIDGKKTDSETYKILAVLAAQQ
jgi:hypothetical protein